MRRLLAAVLPPPPPLPNRPVSHLRHRYHLRPVSRLPYRPAPLSARVFPLVRLPLLARHEALVPHSPPRLVEAQVPQLAPAFRPQFPRVCCVFVASISAANR